MPTQARVVWDQSFTGYDFGLDHPMNPLRLDLTARLCGAFGLFDGPDVEVVNPAVPDDEVLLTVHDAAYVAAVRQASVEPRDADQSRGLGTEDDPAFHEMHDISARIAAGSLDVAGAVWRGETEHGVNFCGGLHHAMPDRASGFCIYNDVAVAIKSLLDNGAQRVAYVDVDVHHGDGVERIFWDTHGCSPSRSTRPVGSCSRAPVFLVTSAGRVRQGQPSTWRCRPAPVMLRG